MAAKRWPFTLQKHSFYIVSAAFLPDFVATFKFQFCNCLIISSLYYTDDKSDTSDSDIKVFALAEAQEERDIIVNFIILLLHYLTLHSLFSPLCTY